MASSTSRGDDELRTPSPSGETLASVGKPAPPPSSMAIVRLSSGSRMPSVMVVPVAGLGQASRTKNANLGSSGSGSSIGERRSRWMLAAQPVAPVPVATIKPDED